MSAVAPVRGVVRLRRARGQRSARRTELACGLTLLGVLLAAFVIVPVFSSYDPTAFVGSPNEAPSGEHLFGTDSLGRDLFVRCFAAGRTDALIAFFGVGISLVIGTALGVAVGLVRNRAVEAVALRLMDAVIAIPFVILVLALVMIVGRDTSILGLPPGVPTVILAIALITWAPYARLARAQTVVLRDREFVLAARTLGYSRRRITIRHIAPNVLGTALTHAAGEALLVIIATASLAFLGAGVQEPTPELGTMIYQGKDFLETAWWQSITPGAIIVLLGFAITLVADALISDE